MMAEHLIKAEDRSQEQEGPARAGGRSEGWRPHRQGQDPRDT